VFGIRRRADAAAKLYSATRFSGEAVARCSLAVD
jgi:hypothetical protein